MGAPGCGWIGHLVGAGFIAEAVQNWPPHESRTNFRPRLDTSRLRAYQEGYCSSPGVVWCLNPCVRHSRRPNRRQNPRLRRSPHRSPSPNGLYPVTDRSSSCWMRPRLLKKRSCATGSNARAPKVLRPVRMRRSRSCLLVGREEPSLVPSNPLSRLRVIHFSHLCACFGCPKSGKENASRACATFCASATRATPAAFAQRTCTDSKRIGFASWRPSLHPRLICVSVGAPPPVETSPKPWVWRTTWQSKRLSLLTAQSAKFAVRVTRSRAFFTKKF